MFYYIDIYFNRSTYFYYMDIPYLFIYLLLEIMLFPVVSQKESFWVRGHACLKL